LAAAVGCTAPYAFARGAISSHGPAATFHSKAVPGVARDAHGKIARSPQALQQFKKASVAILARLFATTNQGVVGSIPAGRAKIHRPIFKIAAPSGSIQSITRGCSRFKKAALEYDSPLKGK